MSDKKLEFSFGAKQDASFARVLKTAGDSVQGLGKQQELLVKSLEKWGKLSKEVTKFYKEQSNRTLKEHSKVVKDLNVELAKVAKNYENADRYARRWADSQAKNLGVKNFAQLQKRAPILAGQIGARSAGMADDIRSQTNDMMQEGFKAATALAQQEQEEKMQRRQETGMKLIRAGAAIQAGAQIFGGASDLIYGASMKELAYGAQSASFAGKLYNEIASGDFSTVYALSQTGAMARLAGIAGDQSVKSRNEMIARGLSGVGQTVKGVGEGALAAGMSSTGLGAALGSAAAIQAGSDIGGGVLNVSGAVVDAMTGKISADTAAAASQASEYLKNLNPIQRRQFQELMGRLPSLHTLSAMNGGSGVDAAQQIALSGMIGGLTMDQAMPYFQGLRGATSNADAYRLLGTTTTAMDRMGISRDAAGGALGALTGTMSGGADAAVRSLEGTMRRAFAMGINDSRLKEVLSSTVVQLSNTIGGRAGDTGVMDALLMSQAQSIAAGQGRAMNQADIGIAAGGIGVWNRLSSGSSGINPLDVATANANFRVASRFGLSGTTALALNALDPNSINVNSQAFRDLTEGMSPERRQDLADSLLKERAKALQQQFPGYKPAEIATLLAKEGYGTYDQVRSALNISATGGKAPGLTGEQALLNELGVLNKPGSAQGQGLAEAAQSSAAAQMTAILSAMSDDKMVGSMDKVAKGAVALAKSLESMTEAQLRDVPNILNATAEALEKVGAAAQGVLNATGQSWQQGVSGAGMPEEQNDFGIFGG